MKLQLKPGFQYEYYTVRMGDKAVVTFDTQTERVTIRHCRMLQTVNVTDGVSWVKTAHLAFDAAGWDSPWINAAVNDRDPRIVAALDVIEGVSRDIDKADLPGDRCRLALEALGQVEHILTRPVTSEATP
jgi:hypothetical protein